jgi:hypothetical protein
LGFKKAVTCVALQSLFRMLFMIERNGLIGFEAKTEGEDEKKQYDPDRQSNEEGFHEMCRPFIYQTRSF